MYLEREKYKALLNWKEKSRVALYLQGPRQVGKTYLLEKLGKEEFRGRYVLIDLARKNLKAKFEELYIKYNEELGMAGSDEERGPVWEAIFKEIAPAYANTRDFLVIIDEIQESSEVYSRIREMVRALKSRLAVTGSYLGIVKQQTEYFIPAGATQTIELSSLSYIEFIQAALGDSFDDYDKIKELDYGRLTEREKEIYEKVRRLYNVYLQIGGYPAVVYEWISNGNLDDCKMIIGELIETFYKESSRYFEEIVGRHLWSWTLERITDDIATGKGNLDLTIAKDDFRGDQADGLQITRKEKINALKWLVDCRIIGIVGRYQDLKAPPTNRMKFYFRDMGILHHFCTQILMMAESTYKGVIAENFVYLYLQEQLGKLFSGASIYNNANSTEETDFIVKDRKQRIIGIEVKFKKGDTTSGDEILKRKEISKLIRVKDTFGGIYGNKATIPIFAINKSEYFVEDRLNLFH